MLKTILTLTALILLTSLLFPWWIIVIVSFLYMALKKQKSLLKALLISFISGFLAYLFYSLFMSIGVQRSPAELIANLLGELPSWSSYIITSLVGGIAAAFGGVSGYLGKVVYEK